MLATCQNEDVAAEADQDLFRTIAAVAKDAIIVMDGSGKIALWNAAASTVFGYSEAEALGRDAHLLLAPERYLPQATAGIQGFRNTGHGAAVGKTIELAARRKDGTEFPIELSLSAAKQGDAWHAVAIIRDITERKRAEEDLRRFRDALDISADIIAIIDRTTMRCVDVNHTACRKLGYKREELLNIDVQAVQPRMAAGRLEELLDKAATSETGEGTFVTMLRRKDGSEFPVEVKLRAGAPGGRHAIVAVGREVASRLPGRESAGAAEERLRTILDAIQAGVIVIDEETHVIVDANPAALNMFGAGKEAVVGSICHRFICPAEHGQCPVSDLGRTVDNSERVLLRANGEQMAILKTVVSVVLGGRRCLLESFVDITPRKRMDAELRAHGRQLEELVQERSESLLEAQRQVLQGEKLASVGRLAAGIAHEINTPIQYVGDNLHAVSDFLRDLGVVISEYRKVFGRLGQDGVAADLLQPVLAAEKQHDLDFILEDSPKAVTQALDGVQRVAQIVRAMKDFSHFKSEAVSGVDINRCLESTLTVARNEYKYHADLQTDFGSLPLVECYPSELNQVFLNLLINAAHAIQETGRRGRITVSTRAGPECVEVAIADTGMGIPEDIRTKVYDPFFTTKEVGKGTGQGLFIARQIIVGKHGGTLNLESEVGKGTTFRLCIPTALPSASGGKESTGK